jgi:ABC-type sulfate transport system substrate-binding protein
MMINKTDLIDAIQDHFEQLNRDWNNIDVNTYRNPYYHVVNLVIRQMSDEQLKEWLYTLQNNKENVA